MIKQLCCMLSATDILSQIAVLAPNVGKEDADVDRNERIFRDIELLLFWALSRLQIGLL